MKYFMNMLFFLFCLTANSAAFSEEPQQKFQGFNLQGYAENGEKAWDVNGDTADVNGTEVKITNVDAKTYGNQNMNVTAKIGYIDQVSGKMHLEKDVVVTSQEGSQMMTDSLDWNRNMDLVKTEDDVLIKDDRFTATSKGMTAQPSLKQATLTEDVRLRVKTEPQNPDSRFVTITSDGPMEIDQAKSIAIFQDNVYAVQDNQTLKADRMEVHFDQVTNQINNIVCIGHVEISQGENRTFADQAIYNAKDRKLTLSGRPKLIMQTEGENAVTAFGNKESN